MDKLKEQLAVVKEHSFWILCGGILLVSLISWYKSTSDLQAEQKKYKGEIEAAVSTLNAVRQTNDHPNESTNKGMDAVTLTFGEDVYQAWKRLSENQERVLVWGGIFGTDERFQSEVRPLRPIETKVGTAEIITTDSRTLYREYIDDQLPKLAQIISGKWHVDNRLGANAGGPGGAGMPGAAMPGAGSRSGGPVGGGAGMPGMAGSSSSTVVDDDPSVLVIWDPANQKEISDVHFSLATREAIPTTLEVLYAQEDLWVFENLMNIIHETNKDATRKHEAAIKYIEYVRIGKSAGDVSGQITLAGSSNASGGGAGGMPGMPAGGGMPTPAAGGGAASMPSGGAGSMPSGGAGTMPSGGAGTMPSGGAGTMPSGGAGSMPGAPGTGSGAANSGALASGRYVDLNYASILDINRLRNGMKGEGPKEDMLLAVAKRMPVRMQFRMDQKRLPLLLAECGNSKLPVEVRQVRINRSTVSSSGGAGASPGMSGGMPGSASAGGGPGMPASGGASGGGPAGFGGGGTMPGMPGAGGGQGNAKPASIASSKTDPNEITVEIYGIVYLYNPPDRKILGIPEPAGSNVPGPVTTPASTTKPATPPISAGAATGR
jgi:hypothetical protein